MPQLGFEAATGRLMIYGDVADNLVQESLTDDGYVEITIDGVRHSAGRSSPVFDSRLAGATRESLREIVMVGRGGNDQLVMADQSLSGSLHIETDGALSVAGAVRVGHDFYATAATIAVTGSIAAPGGHVRLLSGTSTIVEGVVDVSATVGGVGGRAEVLGPLVALLDTAVIDARGMAGGGVVLIGGDFQGHNPEIPNAQWTLMTAGSAIHADALASGAGGTVIVWADTATRFYGLATARAGGHGGDGGLIEISGKDFLGYHGKVDLGAPSGRVGTLLLDPANITISSGSGDSAADGTNTFSGTPSGLLGQILTADTGPTTIFETELEGLAATVNIILQATNNITIANLADNLLNLAATTGSLTIRADSDASGAGNFSMNTGDTIRTQGGAVNIRGAGLTAVGPINTSGAAGVAGGAVTLTADNGIISVTGAITTTGGSNAAGGAVALTASSTVTVTGTITTSGGAFAAGNPGRNAGAVTVTGSTVSVAAITSLGTTATSGGNNGGAGGAVLLDATAGAITVGGGITTTGGNGNGAGAGGNAGNITLNDAASLTGNRILSSVGGTGGTAGAGGNIQLLGTINSSNATDRSLTLTAGTGDVTTVGAIGTTFDLLSLTITGNDISLGNIGGGAAGLTGATNVTATTAGGDTGSVTFTGTTYNANAQAFAAPAGNNFAVNAAATTTFTTTADVVTFTTGTLLLANGSNLAVNTANGAISATGGIRGTSFETVTLNSGTTTLSVGAIGSGNEIASVALTASTATLSGDIVTGDTAGNNVTITGAVTLNNTVGTTLTIDADNATNDGTISISGAVTGAARNLALLGGAISTAAITTTGGSNQDGGAVTLTGSGAVTVTGIITTSGGAFLAGNPGKSAGAVAITGSTVSVVAITGVGTSATSGGTAGGNGASVLLDTTAGGITLGGDITTTGGNGNGAGAGGNAGSITINDAATLTGNRILSAVGGTGGTAGAGGNIQLLGTVNGDASGTRSLTLTAGGGDVTTGSAIGAINALSALTITGNDISLAAIGAGAAGVTGATNVTAADFGGDTGSIQLNGAIRTTGAQTYGGTGTTSVGANLSTTNSSISLNNAVVVTGSATIDSGTATATFGSTLSAGASTLVVSADEISLAGNVSGSGNLTFRPSTTGAQMQLGSATTAANRLDLTPAKLAFIQPGFSSLTFGRSDSTAAVTVNAVTLSDPTTIAAGTTALTVVGTVTSSSDLRLDSGSGGIALDAAVNVGANNLTLDSAGSVNQSAPLTASGLELLGNATFNLTISTNNVDTLAANIDGSLSFTDVDNLTVGTVGTTVGITTGNPIAGGSVTITASDYLTIDQTIDTSTGTGGVLTANGAALNATPVLGAGNITLNGRNHAPLNSVPGAQSTNEETVLVFSSGNGNLISISDVDAYSNSVEVTLSVANGSLTLSGTGGLTFGSGDGTADATMTFTGTVANINVALAGFSYQPTANYSGGDTLTITSNDQGNTGSGGAQSDSDAVTLTVTPVNDAPSGANNTVTTLEDAAYTFAAADFGFSDPSDSPAHALTAVRITTLPAAGSLTNGGVAVTAGQFVSVADIGAGNLVFTPAANASGAAYASFTFQVQDNGGTAGGGVDLDPSANVLTVNVTPVNDAPSGADSTVTTLEDAAYTFAAADFGFSDPSDTPAHALTAVRITTLPAAGSLTNGGVAVTAGQFVSVADIGAGNLVFTPAANASGTAYASFTFQVQDDGGTANGGADLDPSANVLTVNVTAVNDAPSGANNTVTTLEDAGYVLAAADFGFSDPADSPANTLLAARITTLPTAGGLTNGGVAVTAGQFIAVADITAGNLVFTPAANASGTAYASFTFQVQDDGGTANGGADLDATPNSLTINVTPVNDAPSGTNNTVTTLEDAGYVLAAADFGFSDPSDSPAHALLAVQITTLPTAGSLKNGGVAVTAGQFVAVADIGAGNLVFTPAANANGAAYASFTFQVQDNGGTTNGGVDLDPSANVLTVNVTPVNDAPLATNNSYSVNENGTLTVAAPGVLANDSDVEGNPLSAVLVSGPTNGSLVLRANGSFDYRPNTGFEGTDSFTYRATDGTTNSNIATVTITVYSADIIAIGSDSGPTGASRPSVRVYDAKTNALKFIIPASATYGGSNKNGIRVAVADIDGDGFQDIITAPGRNTRPDIKIFRGTPQAGLQGTLLATIPDAATFGTTFVGGVNLAVGDVDGDGAADVIVAPDQGKATIKVFHNRFLQSPGSPFVQTRSFNAFADLKNYNGGGRLAIGNIWGGPLSTQELIVATGAGVAGKIRLFSLTGATAVRLWTKSDPSRFTGGLYVAAGDVNGDGMDDFVTSTGQNGSARIRVYNHAGTQLKTFFAFAAAENRNAAVRVTLRDVDGDGRAEIFAAQGQDGRSGNKVKKFDALTAELVDQFFATSPDFRGGGLNLG